MHVIFLSCSFLMEVHQRVSVLVQLIYSIFLQKILTCNIGHDHVYLKPFCYNEGLPLHHLFFVHTENKQRCLTLWLWTPSDWHTPFLCLWLFHSDRLEIVTPLCICNFHTARWKIGEWFPHLKGQCEWDLGFAPAILVLNNLSIGGAA